MREVREEMDRLTAAENNSNPSGHTLEIGLGGFRTGIEFGYFAVINAEKNG